MNNIKKLIKEVNDPVLNKRMRKLRRNGAYNLWVKGFASRCKDCGDMEAKSFLNRLAFQPSWKSFLSSSFVWNESGKAGSEDFNYWNELSKQKENTKL